jgi:hypothetical protein
VSVQNIPWLNFEPETTSSDCILRRFPHAPRDDDTYSYIASQHCTSYCETRPKQTVVSCPPYDERAHPIPRRYVNRTAICRHFDYLRTTATPQCVLNRAGISSLAVEVRLFATYIYAEISIQFRTALIYIDNYNKTYFRIYILLYTCKH